MTGEGDTKVEGERSASVDSHADTVAEPPSKPELKAATDSDIRVGVDLTGTGEHSSTVDDSSEDASNTGGRAGASASDSLDDLLGITLQDRYKISRKIGQGGMGAVYEATHLALGKRVAVKVLLDKYAEKETVVARLEQEARLASSIGHDHIIDITDFGETQTGRTFVVMEYLEGESLGQCLARESPLSPSRAIPIVRQAASALGAAHKKGVIHRDVKPENIFLRHRNDRDSVKVVDFGISKMMTPDASSAESPRLTQTGMVLGTPLYMSPEQARGDDNPDHRVDVYALGVILYECVTGEVPFSGTNYLSIVSQVISNEPTSPRDLRPGISQDLEAVILKALSKEPEDRYQSMAEFDADLAVLEAEGDLRSTAARITASRKRSRSQRRRLARTIKWVAGAAVVASLVVIAVILTTGNESSDTKAVVPSVQDAAPQAVAIDAVPTPAYELASIRVDSKPSGAKVFRGDREEGVTPIELSLLKSDQRVRIIFELDGYDDGSTVLSPLEDDGKPIMIRLVKAKKSGPRKLRKKSDPSKSNPNGAGSGSGSGPGHQHGGGDLTQPYQ